MLKILIADDHAVIRCGLRHILAGVAGFIVAGEARNGRETLDLVKAQEWDLLLLEIDMPDIKGLEVLRNVKKIRPQMPVLVFSMYAEDQYAKVALDAGAAGFLPKRSGHADILEAIRRAGRGERYLTAYLADKLLSGRLRAEKQPHDALSERELEVMRRLGRGESLTAIGASLHLSPKTVSTYRTHLLEKLNLHNNAELTRYLIEHKLD